MSTPTATATRAALPVAQALAALTAAGVYAAKSPARGRCRTLCYLVAGQYVNLGRLRELAAAALEAQATPEPTPAPVAPEPATPWDQVAAAMAPAAPVAAAPVAAAPAPAAPWAQVAAAMAPAARVTLPGEPAAAPLPPAPGGGVAAHRAAAAAGRPVSLAALARDLGRGLGLTTGGRIPAPAAAPTGDPLEGLPWDPGTPAARARVAGQGRRAAILWPVAQAITGAGHPLPASWASDGPVLNGEVGPVTALAALPAALLESAAAALAALPPVTPAQAQALELLRDALSR